MGLELALEVEEVVGDADDLAGASGVVDILDGAAAAVLGRGLLGVGGAPEAHGDADDIVTLLFQEEGCDGGVDSSAHGDDDAGLGHGLFS